MLQAAAVALPMLLPREGASEAAQQPETPFGSIVEQAFARSRPENAAGQEGGADLRAVDPDQAALCAGAWAAGLTVKPCKGTEESALQNSVTTVAAPEAAPPVAPGGIQPASESAAADTTLKNAAMPGKAIVIAKAASAAKLRMALKQGSDASGVKRAGSMQASPDEIAVAAEMRWTPQPETPAAVMEAVEKGPQGFGANAASPVSASAFEVKGTARYYEAMGEGLPQSGTPTDENQTRFSPSTGAATALSGLGRALETGAADKSDAFILSGAELGPMGADAAALSGAMTGTGAVSSGAANESDAVRARSGSSQPASDAQTQNGSDALTDRIGQALFWSQTSASPQITAFSAGGQHFSAEQTAVGVENQVLSISESGAGTLTEAVAMPRLISELQTSLRQKSALAALNAKTGPGEQAGVSVAVEPVSDPEALTAPAAPAAGKGAETGRGPASGEAGRMADHAGKTGVVGHSPAATETAARADVASRIAAKDARVAPGERGNTPQAGLSTAGGADQAAGGQPAREQARATGATGLSPVSETDPSAGKPQGAAKSRLAAARTSTGPNTSESAGAALAETGRQPAMSPDRAEAPVRASAARQAFDPDASGQLVRSAIRALESGETRYHLKLNPENLGEVAVTISARDRELQLTIHAASKDTRDLIENQADGLRSGLADSGYHLGGFSVDVSANGSGGGAFSAFQQDAGRQPPERQPDARSGSGQANLRPAHAQRERVLEARVGAINLRI